MSTAGKVYYPETLRDLCDITRIHVTLIRNVLRIPHVNFLVDDNPSFRNSCLSTNTFIFEIVYNLYFVIQVNEWVNLKDKSHNDEVIKKDVFLFIHM